MQAILYQLSYQGGTQRNKAFFNEQCKEIEENDRIGKTRDLLKKIGDIKGIFHSRMSLIKDRNGKDITEVEEIKKWQEYTEELYKKGLNYQDNLNSVVTHLEPGVLRWALGAQMGLRKHHYKKNLEEVMKFQLSYVKS